MKIGIIGCGWLGLPLGMSLSEEGNTVFGTTTSENRMILLKQAKIEPFLLSLSPDPEGKNWQEFLEIKNIIISIPPRAGKLGENYHIEQIKNLLELIRESPIQNILYISSTSVYSESTENVTELSNVSCNAALVQCENLIFNFAKEGNRNVTILRCGGLMGYDRAPAKYFAGKKVTTGRIPVNFVHRDDVISIIKLIFEKEIWGEVFNVVSPEHPLRFEVYIKNSKELGLDPPVFEEPENVQPFKVISPEKLIRFTGYKFIYPNPLDFFYDLIRT
ncbi:Nucleoside-diphosphate-sugar epimerase [Pseudarcicella hirudinis]|uniref:Nucleoside-diphosphate-sugar epimerase n=1 Tax=Pseudarcicella hirudinis TaxID=1079859 RepID=A0A1I5WSZ9_9BACT|nr:NAD-dependent epimerase/dehydratase family protein [Pseudarcicella hirudinis]SFQ22915.1 Nucleoside-diphosphate-sugar epimerase [Pseudarcicella hirudinis]